MVRDPANYPRMSDLSPPRQLGRAGSVPRANGAVPVETMKPAPVVIRATPFVWRDPATIPKRQFIYGGHYARRYVSTTTAAGGLGKSSLVIVESLAIVTSRPLLGIAPTETTKVWIWNGEDPLDETERRITAAMLHYDIKPDELDGRLFVNSGRDTEIVIAEQTRDGATIRVPVVEAVTAAIRQNGIGLVIVNPFVSSHRVQENDNGAVDRVVKTWARIAETTSCAVELVHHGRKTNGAEVTVEDARGASALLAAARSARVLNPMTPDEAARAGVENRRLHFRVDRGKANLVAPSDQATWHKLASVDLGNGGTGYGDSVGVVTAWDWPNPMDDLTVADLRAAQAAVAGGGPWRASHLAKDWVGRPIAAALGLDLDDKADKAKVAGALKVWISTGMFVVYEAPDKNREPRPFIKVGERAND